MDGALGPVRYVAAALFVLAAAAIGAWFYMRRRPSPIDLERQRRLAVNATGRMVDGFISDIQGLIVFYSYSVSGVDYATAQDLSTLPEAVQPDSETILGPATIKYSPRNPANSIVICETWSGVRLRKERNIEE